MFDVLCITSRYEGFPYVLIEALALGVPVVSTAIGGATQALRGDGCGSVVDEFDPEEFADRILQLRQQSATEVSVACGHRFEAEFQIERMVSELETVYFQVLQG
jgi:glycosyltransferase involved in cell wall biosynthesis